MGSSPQHFNDYVETVFVLTITYLWSNGNNMFMVIKLAFTMQAYTSTQISLGTYVCRQHSHLMEYPYSCKIQHYMLLLSPSSGGCHIHRTFRHYPKRPSMVYRTELIRVRPWDSMLQLLCLVCQMFVADYFSALFLPFSPNPQWGAFCFSGNSR